MTDDRAQDMGAFVSEVGEGAQEGADSAVAGGFRDLCLASVLPDVLPIGEVAASGPRHASLRQPIAAILVAVGRLFLHIGQLLLRLGDEQPAPPVLGELIPGDPLPLGPRIPTEGLKKAYIDPHEGTSHEDPETKKALYGPTILFWFLTADDSCTEYTVLQLSKLKVEVWDPDKKDWREHPNTHDWNVDGGKSDTDPTSKDTKDSDGRVKAKWPKSKVFSDSPGTPSDPWTNPAMKGKKFRYTHDFETYIVCLKPTYKVLGFYSWGYVMEVDVGDSKEKTTMSYPNGKPRGSTWKEGIAGGNLKKGLDKWNPKESPKWVPN